MTSCHYHIATGIKQDQEKKHIIELACRHLTLIICELIKLNETTNTLIHLDIEPEPDGILETSHECVDFFNNQQSHSQKTNHFKKHLTKKYGC